MNEEKKSKVKHKVIKDPLTGAETTGHVWDDTLMEFNNQIPTWWLWAFYLTIIFSLVYFIIYPSWPTGLVDRGYLAGTSKITFKADLMKDGKRIVAGGGEEITTHWNTRALLAREMQNDPNELKRQKMVKIVAAAPLESVLADPQQSAFVLAYGKGIFGDYCAGCHQTGGQGVMGYYPNLIDDDWLWGSKPEQIEFSIRKGRKGVMPGHKASMTDEEMTQTAHYVLSYSGHDVDKVAALSGKKLFNTKGCSGCHMPDGKGMSALGAANFTDQIWIQANVPAAKNITEKVAAVKTVIADGFKREMPAWESRLSNDEIKVLVAYMKLLSAE